MISNAIRLVIVLSGLLVGTYAYADNVEDIYQVDVIFFEHLDSQRFEAEKWPKNVGTLNTTNAISFANLKKNVPDSLEVFETLNALDELGDDPVQKIVKATVNAVEPPRMLLNEEANILRHSKTTRLIQQVAWMQPMTANVQSTPVLLQLGKNNKEITAVISVKPVRNLFYINADIIYNSEQGTRGIHEFRITREFRAKRKEVFYFDHPLVGMIVMVTPIIVNY